MRVARVFVLLTSIFVLLGSSKRITLRAQDNTTTSTRVDLGIDKSNPGSQAFIPIIFTPANEIEVGTLLVEISFPSKQLVFQEAKNGGSAGSANVNITTEVKNDVKNPEKTVLAVKVENETGPILAGVLVNLVFKILDGVPIGEKIQLEDNATAFTRDNPPRALKPASAGGVIETIAVPVIFACFFYMH
jgi:hypothetical protein